MRPLTAWLEDYYCSITVVNHQLITVIRFVAKSYIRLWKDFVNRLHLALYACEIFFLFGSVRSRNSRMVVRPSSSRGVPVIRTQLFFFRTQSYATNWRPFVRFPLTRSCCQGDRWFPCMDAFILYTPRCDLGQRSEEHTSFRLLFQSPTHQVHGDGRREEGSNVSFGSASTPGARDTIFVVRDWSRSNFFQQVSR